MITGEERELLINFFGGMFNQDWDFDAPNSRQLVALYMKMPGITRDDHRSLSNAITRLSQEYTDDKELEQTLIKEFHSYFLPGAGGLSAHQWLEDISQQLIESKPD